MQQTRDRLIDGRNTGGAGIWKAEQRTEERQIIDNIWI